MRRTSAATGAADTTCTAWLGWLSTLLADTELHGIQDILGIMICSLCDVAGELLLLERSVHMLQSCHVLVFLAGCLPELIVLLLKRLLLDLHSCSIVSAPLECTRLK